MSRRGWTVLLLALALFGAWQWLSGPRPGAAPAGIAGGAPSCRPPAWGDATAAPLQSPVPAALSPFRLQAATLTPLAGMRLDARVLSRRDYESGRESALSPTDLALGWGRMRDEAMLSQLEITQSGRWYRYRWRDTPPMPPEEIVRSSANMHFIPADDIAARALAHVRPGDRVRVEGWLVEAVAPDGWTWRSSLTRDDSGDGACELVYVCSLQRL